ncbi:MAG TPA: IS1182 family transposase [Xanthobacteraceae bacterium]|nr:IS1182 family transposase [Xanthobacteraceae bacterium]
MVDLESQIEAGHLARVVWAFVETLDLSALYAAIRARDEVAGRPTADPRVLLALWLYATAEGVGSARALERLCRSHCAYRWLLGGVPVNYHGLSDFRAGHGEILDRVLSESVAGLAAAGLIDLEEVAADGTKVAANAGRGSFRGAAGLGRFERAARERVERLRAELAAEPAASERRRRAARERAARDVAARAEAARRKLAALQEEKQRRAKTHPQEEAAKKEPQVSTTDPQARIMRMADGSFRPAYNVIVSATPAAQVVLGIAVSDRRNDVGIAGSVIETIAARFGRAPARLLLDTRAATRDDIVAMATRAGDPVTVYSPPPPRSEQALPDSIRKLEWRRRNEPPAVATWRARMATAQGRAIYARRRSIETINADLKNHGLRRFFLRGLNKVRCEALLHAIAHNLRRASTLGHAWA